MADERFSLKDHLFNPDSIGDLAAEYSAALPDFDAARFQDAVLAGFPERELMARMEWIADCLEPQLSSSFPEMADQLEAAMPPELDPSLSDDDFGRFIHAVPGILAVRHGLEAHRDRALDLLYAATKRFSMEFYVRSFLNRWPEETLARLAIWAEDDNYHVRRLVSEGTRPKLPWAKAVSLTTDQTMPLLDRLHADPTRYVTRSVANHLNDITKSEPRLVVDRLQDWARSGRQASKELDWMTRHALRTMVKAGDPAALRVLGYNPDAEVAAHVVLDTPTVQIGDALTFTVQLDAPKDLPVLVDYVMTFPSASGKERSKTFKLKQSKITAGQTLVLAKRHPLKGNATTFTLVAGPHHLAVQVNGVIRAEAGFDVTV